MSCFRVFLPWLSRPMSREKKKKKTVRDHTNACTHTQTRSHPVSFLKQVHPVRFHSHSLSKLLQLTHLIRVLLPDWFRLTQHACTRLRLSLDLRALPLPVPYRQRPTGTCRVSVSVAGCGEVDMWARPDRLTREQTVNFTTPKQRQVSRGCPRFCQHGRFHKTVRKHRFSNSFLTNAECWFLFR